MRLVWLAFGSITLLFAVAAEAEFGTASGRPPRGGPPPEALEVCEQKQAGQACSFEAPHGLIEGSCRSVREGLVCVPGSHRIGPPPQRFDDPQRMETQRNERRPSTGPLPMPPQSRGTETGASEEHAVELKNKVPDTGQAGCFSNRQTMPCDRVADKFNGQDGHYRSRLGYRDNGDGSVTDLVTGLVWQQSHNVERLAYTDAAAACRELDLAGRRDWRLPTITELFSISHWSGGEQKLYIDNRYFDLREPDDKILLDDPYRSTHRTSMMGQTWSSTEYVGRIALMPSTGHVFFFNFLDGRIKSAPKQPHNRLFYRCVRGAPWGDNAFQDNHDATVTDRATGLMWQQEDDGQPRDWSQALRYCETLKLAGYRDWRLPNVKELQTLVDYRYHDPAIDADYFRQQDKRGWFWSSTTHGESSGMAGYVCFGKCTSVDGEDVHGAGAQRSDPKTGNPARWRARGGQRDETRIFNYARCVRDV